MKMAYVPAHRARALQTRQGAAWEKAGAEYLVGVCPLPFGALCAAGWASQRLCSAAHATMAAVVPSLVPRSRRCVMLCQAVLARASHQAWTWKSWSDCSFGDGWARNGGREGCVRGEITIQHFPSAGQRRRDRRRLAPVQARERGSAVAARLQQGGTRCLRPMWHTTGSLGGPTFETAQSGVGRCVSPPPRVTESHEKRRHRRRPTADIRHSRALSSRVARYWRCGI